MLKDYLKKIMVFLISSILILGLAELIIRKTCLFCNYMESNNITYLSPFSTIPYKGWVHSWEANYEQDYNRPEFSDSLNQFKTNSLGLRDLEHPLQKDSNEFRIVFLGDSFTEGVGAAFQDTYVQQLARQLNTLGGKKYRLINGGVSGSDPYFSYRLLTDRLLVLQPDLVVLAFNDTDIDDIIVRGGMDRFQPDNQLAFAPRPRGEWWFSYSHLVRGILLSFFDYDWYGLTPSERIQREKKSANELKQIFLSFKKLAEDHSFLFASFHHPADKWAILWNKHKYQGFEEIGAFIQANEIPYFDMTDYIHANYNLTEDMVTNWFWEIDMHCNRKGYRVFAEGLFTYISELDMPDTTRINHVNHSR